MKCRDLEYIKLFNNGYTPTKTNKKIKNIIGIDTETQNGKCFLLGHFSKNSKNILESTDNYEILTYLLKKDFNKSFNFFYNITYDFQAILKGMPKENLKDLCKWDRTIYEDIKIVNLPNKMFQLSRKNKTSKFFDLAQFYNHNKLDTSANKFLGYGKEDLKNDGIDITRLSFDRYKKDIKYYQNLRKYIFRDCEITYKLGNKLIELVKPYINPKYFYSQASFSQQYFLEKLNKQMNLPSKNILQFAINSYQGGRFETFKRGYFDKSYIYDIKSAYPYHNLNVPDISRGEWKSNKKYESDALISLYNLKTNISNLKISPIKYQNKNNLMTYPIGKFNDLYLNKNEVDLLNDLDIKYKIKKAYHYFDKNPEYPYKFLKKFYNLKEKFKRENQKELSWIPKIILNGFYGKTIQVNPYFHFTKEWNGQTNLYDIIEHNGKFIYCYKLYKAGRLFNPIAANEITANTRVQLYRSVLNNINDVIGMQTDSIITNKPINLNIGNKLGDWEIEKEKESIIILGSGVYQVLGESPKIRIRGFKKNIDLYNLLHQNKYKDKISITMKRNIKLKQVYRLKIDDNKRNDLFNKIMDVKKEININFDKKRIWNRPFRNCKDVLENQISSYPIEI